MGVGRGTHRECTRCCVTYRAMKAGGVFLCSTGGKADLMLYPEVGACFQVAGMHSGVQARGWGGARDSSSVDKGRGLRGE